MVSLPIAFSLREVVGVGSDDSSATSKLDFEDCFGLCITNHNHTCIGGGGVINYQWTLMQADTLDTRLPSENRGLASRDCL